jgi:hypothetical protein
MDNMHTTMHRFRFKHYTSIVVENKNKSRQEICMWRSSDTGPMAEKNAYTLYNKKL